MKRSYRGACERAIDRMIANGTTEISINWSNLSAKEAGSGGADRVTKKLLEAGYRPDGSSCMEVVRKEYEAGQKIGGKYIRLSQEIWREKDGNQRSKDDRRVCNP